MVLAGGYSADIASGAAAAVQAVGSPGKLTGALAAAAAMGANVVPALLPLDGTPALVRLLKALQVDSPLRPLLLGRLSPRACSHMALGRGLPRRLCPRELGKSD